MHKFPLIGTDKGDLLQGNNKNPPKRLFPQSSISQYLIPELLIARYFYKCARIALPISTMWIIHSCRSLSGLCKRHRSNGTPKYLALSVGVEPTVHCNLREEAKAHTPPVAKGNAVFPNRQWRLNKPWLVHRTMLTITGYIYSKSPVYDDVYKKNTNRSKW